MTPDPVTPDTTTPDTGDESELQYDRSVIGREFDVGTVEVTREILAAYCDALGETNPLYTDDEVAKQGPYGGIIAPPSYVMRMRFSEGPDPKVQFGNSTFHAGSNLDLLAPVRPGDTLRGTAYVKEVYEKTGRSGKMVFVVRRLDYHNQHGELVAAAEQSTLHREV